MATILRQTRTPTTTVVLPGGPERSVAPIPIRVDVAGLAAGSFAKEQRSAAERVIEVEKEARERGYREGLEQARLDAQKDWSKHMNRVEAIAESLSAAKQAIADAVHDDAIALAFESIIKLLGDRSVSKHLVTEAIRQVQSAHDTDEPLVVRVGVDDYESLVTEPMIARLEDERKIIRLVEDPRVTSGCIVETTRGTLDARLETQLEHLRKILIDARSAESER